MGEVLSGRIPGKAGEEMKERLIWCPNEIPVEEWEAMSREDQIAWWKNHIEGKPRQKLRMEKVIDLYHDGSITQHELVIWKPSP